MGLQVRLEPALEAVPSGLVGLGGNAWEGAGVGSCSSAIGDVIVGVRLQGSSWRCQTLPCPPFCGYKVFDELNGL